MGWPICRAEPETWELVASKVCVHTSLLMLAAYQVQQPAWLDGGLKQACI